jgi:UDP-N-acetylglucosamine 2-epimerase (non-hydrolysing)
MRANTERPETIAVGANALAGTDPKKMLRQARRMLDAPRRWRNPFGDGRAGERIVDHLVKKLDLS